MFREKFCPDLGRTRTYDLIAIGKDKLSLEDHRANTRKRVAKHRAKKASSSVTVTDKAGQDRERKDGPKDARRVEDTSRAPGEHLRRSTSAVTDFDGNLKELSHIGDWTQAAKFIDTTIPLNTLHVVIKFLVHLYELKEKRSEKGEERAKVDDAATVSGEGARKEAA